MRQLLQACLTGFTFNSLLRDQEINLINGSVLRVLTFNSLLRDQWLGYRRGCRLAYYYFQFSLARSAEVVLAWFLPEELNLSILSCEISGLDDFGETELGPLLSILSCEISCLNTSSPAFSSSFNSLLRDQLHGQLSRHA